MAEFGFLATFHFLRPWWLLAVVVALGLFWLNRKRAGARRRWGDVIAPHLLAHLVVGGGSKARFGPAAFMLVVGVLGGLALAGPTWKREPPPFAEDQAAIVLVLDASQSMNAIDVQPTRLERAKQKVRDLLALRQGARTGLVAYAGDAHVVLPLTDDRGILELYLEALAPDVMPVAGNRPAGALALAQDQLDRGGTAGSILFFTSGIGAKDRPAFADHRRRGGAPVQVLAVGTERGGPIKTGAGTFATSASGERLVSRLDRAGFAALEEEAGVAVTYVQVGDRDVERLDDRAQRELTAVQAADERSRWKDFGYYLLFPLVLLGAFWFRRGWAVRWVAVLLVGVPLLFAEPAHAHESDVADLFWTPDQQGRRHFEKGEYAQAADHFQDPMWKGVAWYAAEEFEKATEQFARLDTAEAWFNLGNAYAHLDRYEDALRSYEEALRRKTDHEDARLNHALVTKLQKQQQEEEDEPPAEGGSKLEPDEIVVDDEKDKRKRPEQEETVMGGTMDENMAEIWMRQVQTRPADFLRMKFQIQSQAARKEEDDR